MPKVKNKNVWGVAGLNVDAQRRDLYTVKLSLPAALGGAGAWATDVQFALESWPFPARTRETPTVKYMNQVNHLLGGDAPMEPIDVMVRYAFNQPTIQLLERWNAMHSNYRTGGVASTSAIKSLGYFYWMVPNMNFQQNVDNTAPSDQSLVQGATYVLEGCMITNFQPAGGDYKAGNEVVNYTLRLSIDRYYPIDMKTMIAGQVNSLI